MKKHIGEFGEGIIATLGMKITAHQNVFFHTVDVPHKPVDVVTGERCEHHMLVVSTHYDSGFVEMEPAY